MQWDACYRLGTSLRSVDSSQAEGVRARIVDPSEATVHAHLNRIKGGRCSGTARAIMLKEGTEERERERAKVSKGVSGWNKAGGATRAAL